MAGNSEPRCLPDRTLRPVQALLPLMLIVVAVSVTSCMPGRQVAGNFTVKGPKIALLVNPPAMVFKFNHRGEDIPGFDSLPQEQQDSALWIHSRFMQFVSDSLVLENYLNRFIDELRLLGLTVYVGKVEDSLLKSNPQTYVLEVAQLQLDEYMYTLEDEDSYLDSVYLKRIRLNAVDFSAWFDLWKVSSGTARKTTLYATNTAYDDFDGRFFHDPFSGAMRYKYAIDTLDTSDLYEMALYLGRRHAGYLYDFFLNQYVAQHLPEGEEPEDYYHFDRVNGRLVSAGDDRLEVLESPSR